MARRKTDSARAREMRGVLAELDKSGLTVNEFARDRGIAVSRLWYWRKRFRDDAKAKEASVRVVPVTIRPPAEASPGLVVEVNGRRVHVPRDFDAAALRRLVVELEAC